MKRFREIMELFLVIVLVVSCHISKKSQTMVYPIFDKQGHRGCRGLMPENTIPAMLKAIDLGVTTLELDVVVTSDKKLILSHEPFFNHEITTKADGTGVTEQEEKGLNIFRMTYQETRKYDVGLKAHPRFPEQEKLRATKPLLSDLFEDVEAYEKLKSSAPVFYNIETKTNPSTDGLYHPGPDEFIELLMKLIQKKNLEKKVIIQSFDYRTLQILHKKYPMIRTAALVEDYDKHTLDQQIERLGFAPSIYSPHQTLVNDSLIKECHEKGIRVIPWTVNDKAEIERLRALGVDGIISDYPNLFN